MSESSDWPPGLTSNRPQTTHRASSTEAHGSAGKKRSPPHHRHRAWHGGLAALSVRQGWRAVVG